MKTAALIAAGAVHAGPLGETEAAADLYRAAIAGADAPERTRPAVQALVALQAGGGRVEDAAATLEAALAVTGAKEGSASEAFEIWARETLVSFYADQLGSPAEALPHQRRLVALRPQEISRRVRLCDLNLQSRSDRLPFGARADNLRALAAAAGDPAAAIALEVAAGRTLAESANREEVARGVALLRDRARGRDRARRRDPRADGHLTVGTGGDRRRRAGDCRGGSVGRADARAALPAGPPPRGGGGLRRGDGGPHAAAVRGRSAGAGLELSARAAGGRPVPRGGGALRGDARPRRRARRGGQRASGPWRGAGAGGDPQGAADSLRRAVARAPNGETAADAALGLFRLATANPASGASALPETLDALRDALDDDPALAAAAGARPGSARSRSDTAVTLDSRLDDGAAPANLALLRFMTGARAGNARAVAEALVEIARGMTGADGALTADAIPLLGGRRRARGWAAPRPRRRWRARSGRRRTHPRWRRRWPISRWPARPPGLRGGPIRGARGRGAPVGRSARPCTWRRRSTPSARGIGRGAGRLRQRDRPRPRAARGLDRRPAGRARGWRPPR